MIRRAVTSSLLALLLVLSSLAAVMAETRMAAAGGYCGLGQPSILLDATGLPLLDADGAAIAAPDCPVCHLATAPGPDSVDVTAPVRDLGILLGTTPVPSLSPRLFRLGGKGRAPPLVA